MFQIPKFGLQRLNMYGGAWNRSSFQFRRISLRRTRLCSLRQLQTLAYTEVNMFKLHNFQTTDFFATHSRAVPLKEKLKDRFVMQHYCMY